MTSKKKLAVDRAEEELHNTGFHEREILSQLWDRARDELLLDLMAQLKKEKEGGLKE